MSLFSYIIVDKSVNLPLPENFTLDAHSFSFQTKDLRGIMDTYYLKEGKLFWQGDKREWKEDKDNEIFGGYFETISSEIKPYTIFTGEIRFYHFVNDYNDNNDAWLEYKAKILDGNIIEIILYEFKLQDNSDRKRWVQEMKDDARREEKLKQRWYRYFVYYWRGFRWYIGERVCKIGGRIGEIGNKILWLGVKIK